MIGHRPIEKYVQAVIECSGVPRQHGFKYKIPTNEFCVECLYFLYLKWKLLLCVTNKPKLIFLYILHNVYEFR